MHPELTSLLVVVTGASLITALGLAVLRKAEPHRGEFSHRFAYFFARSFVTIGIWSALLWILFRRTDPSPR
jgi:hypothetical protein